ncbi:MAG: hypothetical protein ABIN15_07595 [candidate division WOR-3 bacterium]
MLGIYKVLIFFRVSLMILLFFVLSCTRYWWEEVRLVEAPNWAPGNTIFFLEEVVREKKYKTFLWGGVGTVEVRSEVYLWEVDTMGENYRNLGLIFEGGYREFSYLSCGGDWVLVSGDCDTNMYAIRRDLSERRYLGKGMWADISPDGKKFVYVKPNGGGLWIKKIDGTGEHQIVNDPRAIEPAWSRLGHFIAFHIFRDTGLIIIDTSGVIIKEYKLDVSAISWGGTEDSLAFVDIREDRVKIINTSTDSIISTNLYSGTSIHWSPNNKFFIIGRRLFRRDGTKLFNIKR